MTRDGAVFIRVPHEGPWTMTPRSDPWAFVARITLCVVGWELVRFGFVLASRAWIVDGKRGTSKDDVARVRLEAPKHLTGCVHAMFTATMSVWMLLDASALTNPLDCYFTRGPGVGLPNPARDRMEFTNFVFGGYLLSDLAHILARFPKLGGLDAAFHHAVFALCSLVAGSSQSMMLPFAWLLLGEMSTPLLTLRWILKSMAYSLKSDKIIALAQFVGFKRVTSIEEAEKRLEIVNVALLAVTFFFVRVVVYNLGFAHMLWASHTGLLDPIPRYVVLTFNALVGLGSLLNAYWFYVITSKALQKFFKGKEKVG